MPCTFTFLSTLALTVVTLLARAESAETRAVDSVRTKADESANAAVMASVFFASANAVVA